MLLVLDTGNIFLEEISRVMETYSTNIIFLALAILGLLGIFISRHDKNSRLLFSIGLIWFLGGLLSLRLYTGQIHDYYFGLMFPAPFLLAGLIFSIFWQKPIWRIICISVTALIVLIFLNNQFYKNQPNRLIDQTKQIANLVIEKSGNNAFNFAIISDHNSDHAYRYFLEVENRKPTDLEILITDQLIVVCESKKCEPLGDPAWEIAGFGRAEISEEQDVKGGIKVFRLIHWPGTPSPAGRPAIKGG